MSCFYCDECQDFKDSRFDGCCGDDTTGLKMYCEACWEDMQYEKEEMAFHYREWKQARGLV